MEIKQHTLQDIIDSEKDLFLQAHNKYGDFFVFAMDSFVLLENFIKSINKEAFIFAAFLSQIRKHHTLALLSSVRLHHIQTMMNLRQVLEASCCGAYVLGNIDPDFFYKKEKREIDLSKKPTEKIYKWIENNYPEKSKEIKRIKDMINSSVAHSNIVYAHKNYFFDSKNNKFNTPFFDFQDELHVKADLWLVGNVAMGLMDFLYGVNLDYNKIVFSDNFIEGIKNLQSKNNHLKNEALSNPRLDRFAKLHKEEAE